MHLEQEHVHEVELHWHLQGILRYIELSSFSVLKIRPPKCPLLRGFNVLYSQPAIQHTSSKCCLSPIKDPRITKKDSLVLGIMEDGGVDTTVIESRQHKMG
jgi:hypothetical protein